MLFCTPCRTWPSWSARRSARCCSPVASAPAAFIANAGTFAVSALLFATLSRRKTVVAAGSRDAGASVHGGVRTARVTPFVIPLFVVVAMVEFTYGAQTVQLVIYADRSLGLGDGGYGLLLAACGVGGSRQRVLQRPAGDQQAADAGRGRCSGARMRQSVRLREQRRPGARAARHRRRRRRARLLRGGGRDGAGARDPARDARPHRRAVRCELDRCDGRRRGACLDPRQHDLAQVELLDSRHRRPCSWRWPASSACAGWTRRAGERSEALARRLAIIERLPITAGRAAARARAACIGARR